MLFFRSEERVRAWCDARRVPLRPLVPMDQLRTMATTWDASRLEAGSRRPQGAAPAAGRRLRASLRPIRTTPPARDPIAPRSRPTERPMPRSDRRASVVAALLVLTLATPAARAARAA